MLDPKDYKWDDANFCLCVGYYTVKSPNEAPREAWATWDPSFNKGNTVASHKFKMKIRMVKTGGYRTTKGDVDLNTLPAGFTRKAATWPSQGAEMYEKRFAKHIEQEKKRILAENVRKEKVAGKMTAQGYGTGNTNTTTGSFDNDNPFSILERKLIERDPILDVELEDPETAFSDERLQEHADYIRGRLALKKAPSLEEMRSMRLWTTLYSKHPTLSDHFIRFLKQSSQYPLKVPLAEAFGKRVRSASPELTNKRHKLDLPEPDTYVDLNGKVRYCYRAAKPEVEPEVRARELRSLRESLARIKAAMSKYH